MFWQNQNLHISSHFFIIGLTLKCSLELLHANPTAFKGEPNFYWSWPLVEAPHLINLGLRMSTASTAIRSFFMGKIKISRTTESPRLHKGVFIAQLRLQALQILQKVSQYQFELKQQPVYLLHLESLLLFQAQFHPKYTRCQYC